MPFIDYIHKFVKEKALLLEAAKEPAAEPESPVEKKVKLVTFANPAAKKFYEKEFASTLPLDTIPSFINPSKMKLAEPSIKVDFDAENLVLSLQGTVPESIPDNTSPTRHLTMIDMTIERGDGTLKLCLDHAHFPESTRNQSVLKKYFKTGLPVWDSVGITSIAISAELYAGGYAWAKYGFDFTPETRDLVIGKFKEFAKAQGVKLNNEDEYHHAWEIAAQTAKAYKGTQGDKIGKEFLLNYTNSHDAQGLPNSWFGEIDLTKGSVGRIQLNAFLNGGVTKSDAQIAKVSRFGANPESLYSKLSPPATKTRRKKKTLTSK